MLCLATAVFRSVFRLRYHVTLKKLEYLFFLRLQTHSILYGDDVYRFLGFYSDANTPRKRFEGFCKENNRLSIENQWKYHFFAWKG